MAKGYKFSPKTQREIVKTREAIKNVKEVLGVDSAKALFEVIKNSDWGKSVRQENKELGEQMQNGRNSVAGFVAEKKKFDTKEQALIRKLEGVKKAREILLEKYSPIIAALKEKLGLTESVEELQEALKQYILQRSAAIAHEVREHNQFVDREIDRIEDAFPNNDNKKAKERTEVRFVGKPVERDMKNGEKLLIQPMTLDGVEYTALKIPTSIKEMKVSDLSSQFMGKENNRGFPKMDMNIPVGEALDSDWLVLSKHNKKTADGKTRVDIQAYNKSADTDVLRECLMEGTKPMGIVQTLVLREIVKQGLGDKYVDFLGYKADKVQDGYQNIRGMINEIDSYTGLSFGDEKNGDYTKDGCIIRNRGLYRGKNNNLNAFVRGDSDDDGCMGGVASLRLYWNVDDSNGNIGFRSGL